MAEDNVIDRMYAALAAGEVAAARACYTPDAAIWHSFDCVSLDRDAAAAGWQAMVAHFPERHAIDVRRQPTPTGFVQQHLWISRTKDGKLVAWPICIVVQIRDGLIARLDEYIDRAGSFAPGEDVSTTPGM